MSENFNKALAFTLKWEGGFSNHPNDPGGRTMKGITQRVYDGFRKSPPAPARSVEHITDEELHAIYLRNYWLKAGCDKLQPLSAMVGFDIAVNHGPGRLKQFLARVEATADDEVLDDLELARRLIDLRVNFYYDLVKRKPEMKVFLKGWLNRTRNLKQAIGY